MDEPKKPHSCKACGNDLRENATYCKECDSWQETKCAFCKHWLPVEAKRCNDCGMYQEGLRSLFPFSQTVLTLLVALVAVISPAVTATLYLIDRPSHTRFKVSGADDQHLFVKAWNTGRQPSTLIGYHLSLENANLPSKTVELDLSDEDKKEGKNVISSPNPVTIRLVTSDPNWLPRPDHTEGFTSEEFKKYEAKTVSLNIDVDESWWTRTRSDDFQIKQIRAFLCGECSDVKR